MSSEVGARTTGNWYQFVDESPKDAVPRQFVESINAGIQEGMRAGVLAAYEMVDLCAVLYHVEYSNEMAFKIAGCMAFREAARKASPLVLEPIMSLELVAPEDFAGAIMGDVSRRRGRIDNMQRRVDSVVIHVIAPLAELLGFAAQLRATTQGRSSVSMHSLVMKHLLAVVSLAQTEPPLQPTNPTAQSQRVVSLRPTGTSNPID